MDRPFTIDDRLARRLLVDHPIEAARLLEKLETRQVMDALLGVEVDAAAAVLQALERGLAAACLASWPAENRPELLDTLDPGLAARLLRSLDSATREELLSTCPERVAGPIRRLSRYPEETVGALMDPSPLSAPEEITVEAARGLLARSRSRTRGYLYVVDRAELLVGVIEIEDLLQAPPAATLGSMMKPATARLPARADRTAVASHPGWGVHHTLPVVDRNEVLVGAVGYQSLRELEGDPAGREGDPPLGLAMGDLYWTVLSALVEGVVRSLGPRDDTTEGKVQR